MTEAGTWRALSPTERIHAAREVYIGYVVHTAGPLDPRALATAYAAVCRAYPQFAARLADGADGPVFAAGGTPPEVRVRKGDPERPLSGAGFDQYRALSALEVVRDGDEASVCLATHHSIADARHAFEVLAALWSCYTDAVRGLPVDLPRRPYPRSLESLLAERGVRASAPAPEQPPEQPPVPHTAPLPEACERHVVQHRLTAARTTALAELGHREGVTINGLLAGAALLTEAELRDVPLTELVYRYAVDLRHRLTPPVGPTEGTNVLGGVAFRAGEEVAADAVAIGRAIGAQLRAGLSDGSVQRSLLDLVGRPAPGGRPWDPRTAPTVVSLMNWGRVPHLRTPDGLRLTGFRSASRIREAGPLGGYVVSTFDGRTGIDLAWPEGDPQLPHRLACLDAHLNRLTARL